MMCIAVCGKAEFIQNVLTKYDGCSPADAAKFVHDGAFPFQKRESQGRSCQSYGVQQIATEVYFCVGRNGSWWLLEFDVAKEPD